MKIGDGIEENVVEVDYRTSLREISKIMGKKRIGSVLVTKESKPWGIFTERDLLSKVLLEGDMDDEVGKYSSTPIITVSPDYSIRESARIMADMKIKRLIVMDDEEVKGIFTAADLARVVGESPIDF